MGFATALHEAENGIAQEVRKGFGKIKNSILKGGPVDPKRLEYAYWVKNAPDVTAKMNTPGTREGLMYTDHPFAKEAAEELFNEDNRRDLMRRLESEVHNRSDLRSAIKAVQDALVVLQRRLPRG